MGYYDSWDGYDNPRQEAWDRIIEEETRARDERLEDMRADEFHEKLEEF